MIRNYLPVIPQIICMHYLYMTTRGTQQAAREKRVLNSLGLVGSGTVENVCNVTVKPLLTYPVCHLVSLQTHFKTNPTQ